jgi:hypothetical protein
MLGRRNIVLSQSDELNTCGNVVRLSRTRAQGNTRSVYDIAACGVSGQ